MWLFGAEIYGMDVNVPETIKIARGMSLHKMLRLITISLAGEVIYSFY
jgi:hypothetical protein